MTKGRSSNEARMPQLCNGLAPEERADILRVRPQGALCKVSPDKREENPGPGQQLPAVTHRTHRRTYIQTGRGPPPPANLTKTSGLFRAFGDGACTGIPSKVLG
jgi:hypothetical protein